MLLFKQNFHEDKLIARIKGGLGNQLFCYAAARRLSIINNAELVLDDVSGFSFDYIYSRSFALNNFNINARSATARERMEPFGRIRRKLFAYKNSFLRYENRSNIQQDGLDFDPRILDVKIKGTCYMDGNWQSEDYFKDVRANIVKDLKVKRPTDRMNASMLELICRSNNAVAIHVRWFDYPNSDLSNLNLTPRYYANGLDIVKNNISSPDYFIFSDNIGAAADMLRLPKDKVNFVSHNILDSMAFADLWLMSHISGSV